MDMFHDGTHKLSKFAAEDDVISSMPDNVITNVLDRLPIQDALKTSVLSKIWRLKWTLLTQLVFDDNFFKYLVGLGKEKNYNGRDIGRLLLHLKGPITKFVLYISNKKLLDVNDINHWVLFLSRKGCKQLTLINRTVFAPFTYRFPTQVFSCIELKHLKLRGGCFRSLPSSSGFPNLLSLDLCYVIFQTYKSMDFFARCPLLEILKITSYRTISQLELNQIAKLANLKTLSLNFHTENLTSSSILKFSLLPKLQELTIYLDDFKFYGEAGVKKVPIAFLCLKTLTLSEVDFSSDMILSFVIEMICGSPNLQTFTMMASYNDDVPQPAFSASNFQCSPMEQLQSVVFAGFRGLENEVCLIKSLLACSPSLKKIDIGLSSSSMVGGADGKFMFANKLLKLYRSSPMVEIDLN